MFKVLLLEKNDLQANHSVNTMHGHKRRIVENSNYQQSYGQGTDVQVIISNAYLKNHFKSDEKWSYFLNIQRDKQLNEKAKFSRCLQLFEVTISDDNKRKLENSSLNATKLSDLSILLQTKQWQSY